MTVAPFAPGQIVTAGMLLVPKPYGEPISGGPTSGTTELLLTGSLVIPAQPVDVIVTPLLNVLVTGTAGDTFTSRVRETNVSGTIRAAGRYGLTSGGAGHAGSATGTSFPLAASTPLTLVATLQRAAGTGTGTVSALSGSGFLFAHVYPDPS